MRYRSSLLFCLLVITTAVAQDKAKTSSPDQKARQPETKIPEGKQPGVEQATPPSVPTDKESQTSKIDPALKGLKWRLVGPFRGGRVIAVTGVVGQPFTYYFGGVGGGVWKTTDGGINWNPIADKEQIGGVGAIAVAESDPNVIYVGTGEACWRGNIIPGEGIYKSTDAGKTWQFTGLKDTRHVAKILVHPSNPDVVFVAAMGHAHGTNADRGIFRSMDGGKNWQKVLYKDDKTGAIDLTFDPTNPRILFAALYEARRSPWEFVGGGPGSALYRSADGGTTWKKIEGEGLPEGSWGRVGVTVSGANPNRVWAQIEAEKGGLYRSDDGGQKWTLINDSRNFRQRAWYYTHILADPKNADTIYSANVQLWKSSDGGKTFRVLRSPHGDNHGIWVDPTNPQRMINGNDGGATISVNGGETWTSLDNQPTAQFYRVITDNQVPYRIYGAQQDNTTVSIASRTDGPGIRETDWYDVGGCESGYVAPHPKDPNIVYSGCYGGHISRYDHRTRQSFEVMAWPLTPLGSGAGELKYRWQWTAPIVFSPHDPNVLYHAANKVLKTVNGGQSWTEISPDLTRNEKNKQKSSGGPITQDNTSVEYYNTIFTLVESPLQKNLIWAGTDDGLIHITRDGGANWTNATPQGLPESRISIIEASASDVGTAYAAVDRHEFDDFAPYIYKTADFGKTWQKVNGNLPDGAFVRTVRADHRKKGLLFAGTEKGVYYSTDDGSHWKSLQLNLPMSSMRDLAIKENDLVVATHGRSFWVLDDINPLRDANPEVTAKNFHLYPPGTGYRIIGGAGGQGSTGANPPNGVIIYYHLKQSLKKKEATPAKPENNETPADDKKEDFRLKLEILDSTGKVIRKYPEKRTPGTTEGDGPPQPLNNPGLEEGLNRFNWDLRHERVADIPNSVLWGGGTQGPIAMPGKYQVRLTVDGQSQTQPIELRADPRLEITATDLQKQFDLLKQIQTKVGQANEAVNQIRDVRKQMADLSQRLKLAKDPRQKQVDAARKSIEDKMKPVEEELVQVKSKSGQDPLNYGLKLNNQMAALGGDVENVGSVPTQQAYEVYEMLAKQIDTQVAKWSSIKNQDLKEFNRAAGDVPAVLVVEKVD
jgi:photosystem II stability/assembly factor-like uncharacterized protein